MNFNMKQQLKRDIIKLVIGLGSDKYSLGLHEYPINKEEECLKEMLTEEVEKNFKEICNLVNKF